ncbi:CatB-related O-acetyltransferase [Algoriphagus sp. D3-2-R+10]|uniref:CatB-related O-acetyltransferase n=1 Tax=Algoriphagus aurantiacus TaxID=3103948 RepID=UPI002B3A4742|nr:CatB-related O-acetyltransferase [Algoriphagus sp. D3-2-R+10]MEB2777517.1 CatB-related O-acetyltransferase [Algoriphagus sp. D3-2-R+10]
MITIAKNILYFVKFRIQKYFFLQTRKKEQTIIDKSIIGFKNVLFEGRNIVPENCKFFGKIIIGYKSTLGSSNYFHGNISIGKYCQLGSHVAIHSTSHPLNYLTTYVNRNLFNGELTNLKTVETINIGHDVWIGHGAIILGNIRIGNGAIIGAGAVVNKDVKPFSVVAGVPAKLIRMRFHENIIQEIEDLSWWDLSESDLEAHKTLFFKDFSNKNSIYK